MSFKVSTMTILVISMALALGIPMSSVAAPNRVVSKKSASKKVIVTNLKSKSTKTPAKRTRNKTKTVNARAALPSNMASPKLPSTTPLSTSKATIPNDLKIEDKPKNAFGGSVSASRGTSLVDHQDGTRSDSLDYELNLSYKLSENFGLSMKSGYSQDLRDSEASGFADASMTLSKSPVELGQFVLASPNTSIILPTSKKTSAVQNLQAGLRIGTGFAINPTVNPNLSLKVSISGGQNFHSYETDINGKVLNKYSFSQILSAGYAFGDFSVSGIFIHKNGWSYQNNLSEAFEHAEELGYVINESFSVAVGHTNSGAALRPNGEDSNIALINENSSIVYGALTLAF